MTVILFHIYLTVLLIASITGFVSLYFKKQAGIAEKLLPGFILLTFGVEKFAWYWAGKYGSNHDIFNVFIIVQYLFYSFLLNSIIRNDIIKKAIIIASCIYLAIAALLIFIIQGIDNYNNTVFFVGALGLSFFSAYFLYDLIKGSFRSYVFHSPYLWIVLGILFYYSGTVPIHVALPVLLNSTPEQVNILNLLITLVNCISYLIFIYSFLCPILFRRPKAVSGA